MRGDRRLKRTLRKEREEEGRRKGRTGKGRGGEEREEFRSVHIMEGISETTAARSIGALANTSKKRTSPQGASQIKDLARLPPQHFALQNRG